MKLEGITLKGAVVKKLDKLKFFYIAQIHKHLYYGKKPLNTYNIRELMPMI